MPLWTSVTVTAAPAMTLPVWSVTLPRMRPALACENSGKEIRKMAILAPSAQRALRRLNIKYFMCIALMTLSTSDRCAVHNRCGECNRVELGERPPGAWERCAFVHDLCRGALREIASFQTLDHVKVRQVPHEGVRINLSVGSQKHTACLAGGEAG